MKLFSKIFKNNDEKHLKSSAPIQTKKKDSEEIAGRKGELGEYKIDIQLDQLPKDHKYLSDIHVKNPKAKSGYSQIDHVVISPYGIFVIETKNYQGTVYGGEDRKTWSVNGKFKLMNPFIQNYGHIEALKNYIEEDYHHLFISMVSFTKRSTFKIDNLNLRKIASDELLVYDVELFDYIHRKVSVLKIQHEEPLLTENDISKIYATIAEANISDQTARNEHVQSLKTAKVKSEDIRKNMKEKCTVCDKPVSEKVRTFCLSNKRFNGKIYCFEHQKRQKI
ncbi:nuclease-related domain-containing protein [Bacillus sp. Marseille-Q3570]|uniref:nuclease-related domain-containing protein n=1 Tax=Bacillus sp. Marseille-Q3570 TaxID=2963522 RepID=UPI0021B7B01D|nr:nuclease-related domain-containing protein [Bacillus sp. Marseille-Q3570]